MKATMEYQAATLDQRAIFQIPAAVVNVKPFLRQITRLSKSRLLFTNGPGMTTLFNEQ